MVSSETNGKKKLSPWVVIGVFAAVALVMVFVVCIVLASMHATRAIKDMGELKMALAEKKAINCTVAHSEEGSFVLQANDGFSKVKVVIYDGEGGRENMMSIRDDGTYYWDDAGNAFKLGDNSDLDEFVAEITAGAQDEEEGLEDGYTLACEAPSQSDFAVPDLDFVDSSVLE